MKRSLQQTFNATRGESPAPAKNSDCVRFVEFVISVGDEVDGVSGSEERSAEAIVGGDHSSEYSANASPGDDVEVVGDLSVRIVGLCADLVLKMDESGAGNNGGGSSAVNAENASFGGGSTV